MKESINIYKLQLENILLHMENEVFSKDKAARIVGGPKKLKELISEGKIHAVKEKAVQNSKWKCNAAQVLRHARKY